VVVLQHLPPFVAEPVNKEQSQYAEQHYHDEQEDQANGQFGF